MKTNTIKSDTIGIMASTLCMIHCIATPFIFLAKTCSDACCSASPTWWKSMDVLFLSISLLAVYQTAKNTSKIWVKYAMWLSWGLLMIIIGNEQQQLFPLFENAIYIPALSLTALHFYNFKYCRCTNNSCCTNKV
ncbi:MAG: MerC domain-containing protein [Crocinitomicaceae bacterium]|nr:MerC domain-containing protein [Crocinitomicaceae bacterium]